MQIFKENEVKRITKYFFLTFIPLIVDFVLFSLLNNGFSNLPIFFSNLISSSTAFTISYNLDSRLGDSTWRFTYDYPVAGERDISDLDDKDFVRLRRKKNKIVLLMYSIVLVMFISSMSLLSKFLLFFFS